MYSKKNRSDMISAAVGQYLIQRGVTQIKEEVGLSEYATLAVMDKETSIRNSVAFTCGKFDQLTAETQYTKFKVWISESADHYKPELAQLLYPVFAHLYIRLLGGSAPSPGAGLAGGGAGTVAAHRFHKRHLSTFQGNPEFKVFIQQLGEANSILDLDQNPSIVTFRTARYNVTLTSETYSYLLRYLETSQSHLILNVLNQEVDVSVGDPLGVGSRQETRAILSAAAAAAQAAGPNPNLEGEDASPDDVERLRDLIRQVAEETPPPGPSIAVYRLHSEDGLCVSAEADARGELLVAGCEDSQVRLWNLLPPEDSALVLDTSASTCHLAASARHFANSDRPTTCLTIPRGRSRNLRGHTGTVYSATFLPGDRHVVSVSEDSTVRLWDRENGAALAALHGHVYPVWTVASDCLGVNFATGGMDRTARLWRPEVAHPLRIYTGHENSVEAVSFHPNCGYLVTGSADRTVRMWSVTESRCVRVLTGHKGAVSCVQVSPSGRALATAGEDKRIRIWDLAEGRCIKELRGHTDSVTSLVWGDGRLLCSGGMDGTVRVWDVGAGGDGESLGQYPVHQQPSAAAAAGGDSHPAHQPTTCPILGLSFSDTNTLIVTVQDTGGASL